MKKTIIFSALGTAIILIAIQGLISMNCIETDETIGLFSCSNVSDTQYQNLETQNLFIVTDTNEILVKAEIADDPQERSKGLMFRERLDQDSGMFFVFEREDRLSFWMKNTWIPLDMLFIDENFEIVEIKEFVPPCMEDPCPDYPSNKPARYVLEVNGGFVEKNSIRVSDKVLLKSK